jgi:hypothetical protein
VVLIFAAASAIAGCGGAIATDPSGGNDGGSEAAPGSPPSSSPPVNAGRCTTNANCASSQYCDHGGTCGTGGTDGACKARPVGCPDIAKPVCACDGATYMNECLANAAGVEVGAVAKCVPKTGSFFCGTTGTVCNAATTYCQRQLNDVVGPGQPPELDSCLPIPEACKTDTACACFPKGTPCLAPGACKEIPIPDTATYGLEITCPGG